MSDEKPPEKVTTQIPKAEIMEGLLKQLTQTMVDGFHSVRADMRSAEERAEARFARIEQRQAEHDARAARHSDQAKALETTTSNADLSIQAKQSEVIVKQLEQERKQNEMHARIETLAASQEVQMAILGRLDKLFANPLLKAVAAAVGFAILQWLSTKR